MAQIDEVRQYWNNRPCNIKHSTAQIGSREYFDEVEKRKYFVEPHIPKFAEFEKWKDRKVLEIGCGIGTDAVNFARSGAVYTGVELSEESLNLTIKRFKVFKLSGEFLLGDVEELETLLNNRTFDLIYSFGVLHHTPNFEVALSKIRRFCDAQTQFKFMVYSKNSWKNAMIQIGYDQPESQSGCPIANTYSIEEVEVILNRVGFEVVSAQLDHIFPYKVEPYKKYEYQLEDWFEKMPIELFSKLEKQLGWHMMIDAKIN